MTPKQKEWIDRASYRELIQKVQEESPESEWFRGDTGTYLFDSLKLRVRALVSQDEAAYPYLSSSSSAIERLKVA